MKHRFWTRLAAAALGCALALGSAAYAAAPEQTGRVVVSWDPDDYVNCEILTMDRSGGCRVYAYEDGAALQAGLKALAADAEIALIQPNYAYASTALTTNDAYIRQQWALYNDGSFSYQESTTQTPQYPTQTPGWWTPPWISSYPFYPFYSYTASSIVTSVAGIDLNAEEAWAQYDGGVRDVTIALLDTGVDSSHTDFGDIFWTNPGEIPDNGIDDDGNGYVDDVHGWNFYAGSNRLYVGSEDDHGTHNAGTIAATRDNRHGIAGLVQSPHVKIMVLKALGGQNGEGSTLGIIRAIAYAEANGASICNLSLGGEENDPALYRAISTSSMLFVAAAGNDGVNIDRKPIYPAAYSLPNLISVSCLSCDGALHACSNYGAQSVDLAAPGAYIFSTVSRGDYAYMTGTSMAAPMVTAAAAMVASCSENLSLTEVRSLLLSTVRPLSTLAGTSVTGGMLDLGAAITAAMAARSTTEASAAGAESAETVTAAEAPAESVGGFTDVSPTSAYAEGIRWAAELGIAKGTTATTFSPTQECTTAQILTFLWRTFGAPASDAPCPFDGVAESSPYYTALCWAGAAGLLNGEAEAATTPCTRAAAVTYLWRAVGAPAPETGTTFDDVPDGAEYVTAVAWALEQGVTNGTAPTEFSPLRVCSRGQIVTFLYRAFRE